MAEQNYANHGRNVPLFHFFALPMLIINFGWSIYRWKVAGFSMDGLESVLMAAALFFGVVYGRLFALRVQDRLIRLEEQLRYERVLPEELRWRSDELSVAPFWKPLPRMVRIAPPAAATVAGETVPIPRGTTAS